MLRNSQTRQTQRSTTSKPISGPESMGHATTILTWDTGVVHVMEKWVVQWLMRCVSQCQAMRNEPRITCVMHGPMAFALSCLHCRIGRRRTTLTTGAFSLGFASSATISSGDKASTLRRKYPVVTVPITGTWCSAGLDSWRQEQAVHVHNVPAASSATATSAHVHNDSAASSAAAPNSMDVGSLWKKLLARGNVTEVYSPERVTALAKQYSLTKGLAMNLLTGWDFNKSEDRKRCFAHST